MSLTKWLWGRRLFWKSKYQAESNWSCCLMTKEDTREMWASHTTQPMSMERVQGRKQCRKKALKDEFWIITDLYRFYKLQEECVRFMLNILDLKWPPSILRRSQLGGRNVVFTLGRAWARDTILTIRHEWWSGPEERKVQREEKVGKGKEKGLKDYTSEEKKKSCD